MSIGDRINNNMQLQEFVEKVLSTVFELAQDDENMVENICEEMGVTEDEVWWMFEQLGYEREEE